MRRGDNAEGVVIVGLGQKGQLAAKHAEYLWNHTQNQVIPDETPTPFPKLSIVNADNINEVVVINPRIEQAISQLGCLDVHVYIFTEFDGVLSLLKPSWQAETFLFFYLPNDITPMSSSIRALFISSSKNKEPAVLVPFTKRNMLGIEQESEEFVFHQMAECVWERMLLNDVNYAHLRLDRTWHSSNLGWVPFQDEFVMTTNICRISRSTDVAPETHTLDNLRKENETTSNASPETIANHLIFNSTPLNRFKKAPYISSQLNKDIIICLPKAETLEQEKFRKDLIKALKKSNENATTQTGIHGSLNIVDALPTADITAMQIVYRFSLPELWGYLNEKEEAKEKVKNCQLYIAVNGQTYGPYPNSMWIDLVAGGYLTRQSWVWMQGMANWEPAGNVKVLEYLW